MFIINSFFPLRIVKFVCLQRLAFWLCLRVNFPLKRVFTNNILHALVNRTLTEYVQLTLAKCLITTCNFDLWMSKGGHYIFTIVVNFPSTNWELKHITIGIFEAHDMSGATMVVKLKQILDKFSFTQKILAYVKDEDPNLQTCVQAFKLVVSCGDFGIVEPFNGSCYRHVLSKVCQYANFDEKVAHRLHYVLIKSTHNNIQKCITCSKNPAEGGRHGKRHVLILV